MKRLHATLRANAVINVTAICNDACNVAEVGTISTFGTLQETLPATPAKPVTRSNSVVACNVACNVSSCDSALILELLRSKRLSVTFILLEPKHEINIK